jgi:hypothetical protein
MPNSIVQGSARIRTSVKDGRAKARSKMAHRNTAVNAAARSRAAISLKNSVPDSDVRDGFDDWVVGLQFVPDYLHHPVSANRAFPIRRQTGRFCGDFRHLLPGVWSLQAFTLFRDDFWRPVSASKNSVPGGRALSAQLDRVAPAIPT